MSRGPQSASPGRIKGATHLCELASSWGPFLSWTSLQAPTRAIAAHHSIASAGRREESLRPLPQPTSPNLTSSHPTQQRQPRRPRHPRHPRRPALNPRHRRREGRREEGRERGSEGGWGEAGREGRGRGGIIARDGTVSGPATYLQRVLAARLLERDDGHVVHRAGQQHVILHDLGAKGTGVGSSCRVAGHDTGGRGGGARLRERRRLTGSLTACFGAAATAGPRVILNGARRTLPSGAVGAAAELAGGA